MDVLVTCGVCGLVETVAGSGLSAPGCPRCGSRAVDVIELGDRPKTAYGGVIFEPMPVFLLGPGCNFADVIAKAVPLNPPPPFGGAHWPMTRAA